MEQRECIVKVALRNSEGSRRVEYFGLQVGRHGVRSGQYLSQPAPAFPEVSMHLPETFQGHTKLSRRLHISLFERPFKRRSKVVVVALQPIEPALLLCARELRVRCLGHR